MPRPASSLQLVPGLLQTRLQGERDGAMIHEGIERGWRHRIDRIRADERVQVQRVGIERVLGAGAGPQGALDASALGGQSFPALAAEDLAEAGIGSLGIGDGDLAVQRLGPAVGDSRASNARSTAVSTRLTKKEATEATLDRSPPAAASFSRPAM